MDRGQPTNPRPTGSVSSRLTLGASASLRSRGMVQYASMYSGPKAAEASVKGCVPVWRAYDRGLRGEGFEGGETDPRMAG